jgi:hypothetical protein
MARRLILLTRVLAAALAAPALAASSGAFAQEDAYGPYVPARIEGPHGGAWRAPGYCGQREAVRAPDVMTYDRDTHSEVLVGGGPGRPTEVTGINRETGSAYSVKGDLAGPKTTDFCTANAETGSAYAVRGEDGATVVRGHDGQTGREFAVAQGPEGNGPNFRSFDPESGRSTLVVTPPDGHPIMREFGPHALACTRARLGLGAKAEVGSLEAGGKGGVEIGLGDC